MIGYIIFIFSIGLALACLAYDTTARSEGWSVGTILAKDASLPKIASYMTVLLILVKSFIIFSWWSPLVILIISFFLAFYFVMILKENVQILCIYGIFPALVFSILYISEKRPFGMLHILFS